MNGTYDALKQPGSSNLDSIDARLHRIGDELEYLSKTISKSAVVLSSLLARELAREILKQWKELNFVVNESAGGQPQYRNMDGVPEVVGADKEGEGGTIINPNP